MKVGVVFFIFTSAVNSWGEDLPVTPAVPAVKTTSPADATAPLPSKPQKKKKAPRFEQKENEGTQAKNRFEADSILKSEYHINGQPLEVDPD